MNKSLKIFFLILLSFQAELFAQTNTWERILTYTDVCELKKINQTDDGGFIVAGQDRIGNNNKMFIIKLNEYGDTLWSRHFDVNINSVYLGQWVDVTSDNGFIMCGIGNGINGDAYVVKYDSLGNILWYKSFGGSSVDFGYCIRQLEDGGYIFLVNTNSFSSNVSTWLIRIDSSGNKMWSKLYPGGVGEIQVLDKNLGFIITGTLNNKLFYSD
ncbi:MAG: hypothetical protein IPM38_13525 [Ignavibacteria bacterium]|nr:hypothetical protein [Ignavibacteria bacterium]